MARSFSEIYKELQSNRSRKRMVVAWGVDNHTISAVAQAVELDLTDVILVGDKTIIEKACEQEKVQSSKFTIIHNSDELASVSQAVEMVRNGEGDFLMKGLCSTDKFLRAILNKETGLLPPNEILTHCTTLEIPAYHKLLFMGDAAVIPAPDLKQKKAILEALVRVAKAVGLAKPKVAVIAATEQVLKRQPATTDAAILTKMAEEGDINGCLVYGPLALDVALDKESAEIKGIINEVAGDADILLFPNIESGNVFYKANSKLVPNVRQAGILVGAKAPCVLSSRADSVETKLNSIAIAAMTANK